MIKDKIIWTNNKGYDPTVIKNRISIVDKNLNGLLPLYGSEKEVLIKYAEKNNLLPYEMFSLRQAIKVQREIDASKKINSRIYLIKKEFVTLLRELGKDDVNSKSQIITFFKKTKMPFHHVVKIISTMPEFNQFSNKNQLHIKEIAHKIYENELEIRDRSIDFEHKLENYLKEKYPEIHFRTETDIKRDKDYNVTPDILFDDPIMLEVNGKQHIIRWMDAKNYSLVNISFIMKSLHKQAAKYNAIFGMGAFVFHYGFDTSISVPDAVILDGLFL